MRYADNITSRTGFNNSYSVVYVRHSCGFSMVWERVEAITDGISVTCEEPWGHREIGSV